MADRRFVPDHGRRDRIGLAEAVLCAGKTAEQIAAILADARARAIPQLLTRLAPEAHAALPDTAREGLDYEALSRTAVLGEVPPPADPARVGVVTAGTSDAGVAREAARTLAFHGVACEEIYDVGVAGLWRLLERLETIRGLDVVIVVAGMDAALPSVVGGQVPGVVIGVPTSTGYGVARGGETALRAMLASCAPGVAIVNIDNGYGAACAALRVLGARGAG